MLTFLPGVPGVAGIPASAAALLMVLLGCLPTLISRSTRVPSCVCPVDTPASSLCFSSGSSSSRSDRSLPCLSRPAKSVVQLPTCSTTDHRAQLGSMKPTSRMHPR